MEKEKSSAESTTVLPRVPELLVIRGKQDENTSAVLQPLHLELKRFISPTEAATAYFDPPLDNLSTRIAKRIVDILFSTLFIVGILSWLIPVMALLIKIDSGGAVFFLQKRNKRNGRVFTCIKFRSMYENDEADSLPATAGDERITRLGRFIRKYYIDELPQFFNVWIGDMSFIGPRPHMVSDNNKYENLIEYYNYRHKVKPGITGLSQAMGYVGEIKNIQHMRNRVQLDIFYVRHWSPSLDLKILFYSFRRIVGI
jgi:putative colanic acid biosynthesis UDP-glucose lipid carrier transferase